MLAAIEWVRVETAMTSQNAERKLHNISLPQACIVTIFLFSQFSLWLIAMEVQEKLSHHCSVFCIHMLIYMRIHLDLDPLNYASDC